MTAFREELEGCHLFLDIAQVPRVVGTRSLTLKDRIAVLVEADREYGLEVERELRSVRWIADTYDRSGGLPVSAELPPLAGRVFEILATILDAGRQQER
jgi:hypothetical protein